MVGLLVAIFFFFHQQAERRHSRETATAVAEQLAARIDEFHTTRIHFLEALAADWSRRTTIDRAWFANAVGRIRSGLAGIRAISWIGPDGTIRWTEPGRQLDNAEKAEITRHLARAVITRTAADTRARMIPPFDLGTGGRDVVVLDHLKKTSARPGFVALIYRTQALQAHILTGDIQRNYEISVTDQGHPILGNRHIDGNGTLVVSLHVPVAGRDWLLRMVPANPLPLDPFVLLAIGLVLSLVLAVMARALLMRDQRLWNEVAERRRAEESLRSAKEEAERANESKNRFLAAASHDLRQPLQAASMYVHALTTRLREDKDREVLSYIARALDTLGGLLRGFLDIARLDAGIVTPEVEDFDLDGLLRQLAEEYAPEASSRRLDLRFVPSGAHVRSDPLLLYRILGNLISNALRYTPKGRVLVGCRRCGCELLLQVIDTGVGIPQDQLDHVFQEFYQLGSGGHDVEKGFGLGLSVVRRLVNLLGHRMAIRSVFGRGTTVEVVVPRAQPPKRVELQNSLAAAMVAATSPTVMVIDDEPAVRDSLSRMLDVTGCTTVAAATAADAVAAARQRNLTPDVVIADFRLADGETGVEAISFVRNAFGPVASVILTGESGPDVLKHVQRANLTIMHKPVAPTDLFNMLRQAISATPGEPG